MKKLIAVAALCVSGLVIAGCATQKTTTVTDKAGTTTITEKTKTDPLLTKQVLQEDTFLGIDLNIFGTASMSPAKVKMGFGRTRFVSNPTSTNAVFAAPLSMANHGNVGWFNQALDENTSTATNLLPLQAYNQPQISTANPLLVQVVGTNALPVSLTATNTP